MNWFFLSLIMLLLPISTDVVLPDQCDISGFYEVIDHERDAVVLSSGGDLIEIEQLLIPARIREGQYEAELTRLSKDIYQWEDTDYYIQTRYCTEWARSEEVTISVERNSGYKKGKVFFKD